jgi:two-component system, cell cycle sensor histidine kinase and response regulator CckA
MMAGEQLLLVDDEPALVKLMERYLAGLGYGVVSCQTAREACQLFAGAPSRFALVLADMTMPDMSGEEMIGAMLAKAPGTRVLICSGYPYDLGRLTNTVEHQFGFLQKPFVPRMLAEAVEQMLGPARKAAGE